MKIHPYAEIFPILEGEELTALVADIKANGLREKIWLYDGAILDGRNRYLACQRAHVPPETREFRGTSEAALAFVISANLIRRHLSWDQRRAIAQTILPVQEGLARERQGTRTDLKPGGGTSASKEAEVQKAAAAVSKIVDVGRGTIERDKIVAREVPTLLPLVAAGKVAMGVASPIRSDHRISEANVRSAGGRTSHGHQPSRMTEDCHLTSDTLGTILAAGGATC